MSICPTCNKAVYHAEQVMGPGRVMYHKPCLVCNGCQKRLDPGALQEHDGKPYCRNCHKMMFSPRDLRSANLYQPKAASPAQASPSSNPSQSPIIRTPHPASTQTPTKASTSTTGPNTYRSLDDAFATSAETESTENDLGYAPFRITRKPTFAQDPVVSIAKEVDHSLSARRPAPPQVKPKPSTLTSGSASQPPSPSRTQAPIPSATIVRAGFGGTGDICPACGKKVFMMEAVNALSQKWHKACLRCTSCNSTLDPSKLCDRDGQAYCRKCYQGQFGPTGIR